MELYPAVCLSVGVVYITLLAVIIINHKWQKLYKNFTLYLIAASLWAFSTLFLQGDLFMDHKLLLFKIVTLASMWWVVQLYHFARSFLNLHIDWGIWFGYISLVVFGIIAALGYAPPGIIIEGGTVSPEYGWWLILYTGPMLILASLVIVSLVRRFKTIVEPKEHNKVTYLIVAIGILITFGFGGMTHPADKYAVSHIGGLISACIITYAIIKHELVSVSLVLRRGIAWAGLLIIGIGAFLGLYFTINALIGLKVETINLTLTMLAAALIVAAIFWLREPFIRWVDKFFFRESYDHKEELSNFIRRGISRVFSLAELSQKLLPPLVKALNCTQAYIILPKSGSGDFVAEFAEPPSKDNQPFRITKDSLLLEWLRQENRYLTRDNIDLLPELRGLWEKERKRLEESGMELFFPLISRENLIGILALGKKQSGRYSYENINFVESIANQVAISMEKEYLQEELRKRQQELSLISRLAGVMTSSLNIQNVYDTFVAGLREVIDVDFATVALIEGNELRLSALYSDVGSKWQVGEEVEYKGSATEWVVNQKRSLVEPDLAKGRIFFTGDEYLSRGLRSIVYLPLITKDEGIGSLIIASRKPDAYTHEQVDLLERLASQISTSVANAQLYANAEQRARIDELTSLFNRRHFDESIEREVDRHSRYGSMLSIMFLDLDNFKSYNDLAGHIAGDKLLAKLGHGIRAVLRNIDQAFRYGGDEFAIILPNTSADDAFIVAERVRRMVAAETEYDRVVITASIGLASWPNDGLKPDDIVEAADQALYYAKRTGGDRTCIISQMLPSVTRPNELAPDVEKETLNTIYALAATIEARDPYTYGHSRKVRAYAVALAEALGLPSDKVALVSHAALLHDIGKIGILDEVLNKPSMLDTNEWELIKTHPELSRAIVAHVPSLTPCIPAILHHHERWDGAGYPAGLKGKAIPLEARILAIADAFDAMTSPRPYRAPLQFEQAIDELKRCAGTQFDAELIEIFIPVATTATLEEYSIAQSTDG